MKRKRYGEGCFSLIGEIPERHLLYLENAGSLYVLSLELLYWEYKIGTFTEREVCVELKEITSVPEDMIPCKIDTEFDMVNENDRTYSCDLFEFNVDGGDEDCPCGDYSVEENLFGRK